MWQPGRTLADVEREAIELALKFHHGNKTQTARSLGIVPNTLNAKLDQYAAADLKRTEAAQARAEIQATRKPWEPTPIAAVAEAAAQRAQEADIAAAKVTLAKPVMKRDRGIHDYGKPVPATAKKK